MLEAIRRTKARVLHPHSWAHLAPLHALLPPGVARHTKRLPIGLVPEQAVIALVRNDMVNGGGWCRAHGAMGMHGKESRAGFLPFTRIATLTGRGALAVVPCFAGAVLCLLTGATLTGRNDAATTAMTWRGDGHG